MLCCTAAHAAAHAECAAALQPHSAAGNPPRKRPCLAMLVQEYDWSQHANGTVADVGGCTGNVLAELLRQYPGMKGIVFDR